MKRFSSIAAACLALILLAAQATAAAAPLNTFTPTELGVSAVALNTGPTFTLRASGYSQMTVYVVLTRVAATTLALACTAGPNSAVQAPIPVADVNSTTGQITLVQAPSFKYASPASGVYRFQVSPLNDDTVICTLSGASAGASDLVSAHARLSVPL
jgi:hypothetical protein